MKHLTGLMLIVAVVMLSSCGEDPNVIEDTCMKCHSTVVKTEIEFQFSQSAHKAGAIAVDYAGGRASCAACHSHEGFVQYAANGEVTQDISLPSAWQCKTCHNIHKTFGEEDYALRLAEPINFIFDETVTKDFGSSNLCANCHQSRRAEPNIETPGATYAITSTHYGPHHGSQANILYGVGFAEIAGTASYPAAGSSSHMELGCTGCHMEDYADGEDRGEGGHTFNPSLSSCKECHSSATDFNVGGGQDEIAELMEELRDLLLAQGVIAEEEGSFHPVVATYDMVQVQAFYNWIGLEEDRSHGVHNPNYTKALLNNSIAALQ